MIFAFTFLKSFISQIIPFLLRFWREILIAVMLMLWQREKSSHRATTQELATLHQDIATKTAQQVSENAQKEQIAAKELVKANFEHQSQINQIKDEYDHRTKTNVNSIADLRKQLTNQLREQTGSAEFTMPEVTANTEGSTQEWRERYSTVVGQYETLTTACQITTSDFNVCREKLDADCEQVGCKE